MRKISLDVDALQVESFDTVDGGGAERGTVYGNQPTYGPTDCQTECGRGCYSGPHPCWPTLAYTNGVDACFCDDGTGLCTE